MIAPDAPLGTAEAGAGAPRGAVVPALVGVATLLVGTILVLVRDTVLPARFSYDALAIQSIAQGARSAGDPAYDSVAATYRLLGLADLPVIASLLGFLVAFAVLLIAGRRLLAPGAPATARLLFMATALLSAVFLGTYSKDVLVLPIVLLAGMPGRWRGWPALTGVAIVVYALVFRTYWFVVLGVWVGLQALLVRRPRLAVLGAVLLTGTAAVALAVGLALGGSADDLRAASNEYRVGSEDAATLITPLIPGGSLLTGVLNAPLQLITLLLPVPLATRGIVYGALALVIAAFWVRTAIAVRRSLQDAPCVQERSATALLLAFVMVQALFEPDYGSALRHLTPLLPLAVLLWARPGPAR